MSSGMHKREIDDDSPSNMHRDAKTRKQDGQLFHETEPFDFIDDVTLELRSIEGFGTPATSGAFLHILERLDKSDVLVRRKQGREVDPDPEQRFIYTEDIVALYRLVNENVAMSRRVKFEQYLRKIGSNNRLVRRPTNIRENSNPVVRTVQIERPCLPFRLEPHPSQAIEQPAATIKDEVQEVDSILNLRACAGRLLASSFVTEEPLKAVERSTSTIKEEVDSKSDVLNVDGFLSASIDTVPNLLKNVAETNFNAELLKKLRPHLTVNGGTVTIRDVYDMIKKRATVIKKAQYEYSMIDQQQFCQEMLTKLRGFSEGTSIIYFKTERLIEMLQLELLDNLQCMCPFVGYLTDFDLLKYIMNNSDNAAAQNILRARKLQLRFLSFELVCDIITLKVSESVLGDNSVGIFGHNFRRFEYGMMANIVVANDVLKLFNTILQFYDVSKASILLKHYGPKRRFSFYHLLESTFGEPPTDQNFKIRIMVIRIESPEMLDFFRWFCPSTLNISCDPGLFVDEPLLISGVDVIECSKSNADRLMENSKAGEIRLDGDAEWSDESIVRVLTTHMLSKDTGCPRKITYQVRHSGTAAEGVKALRELFDAWSRDFDADHGNTGRNVTLSHTKFGNVTFTLC